MIDFNRWIYSKDIAACLAKSRLSQLLIHKKEGKYMIWDAPIRKGYLCVGVFSYKKIKKCFRHFLIE